MKHGERQTASAHYQEKQLAGSTMKAMLGSKIFFYVSKQYLIAFCIIYLRKITEREEKGASKERR